MDQPQLQPLLRSSPARWRCGFRLLHLRSPLFPSSPPRASSLLLPPPCRPRHHPPCPSAQSRTRPSGRSSTSPRTRCCRLRPRRRPRPGPFRCRQGSTSLGPRGHASLTARLAFQATRKPVCASSPSYPASDTRLARWCRMTNWPLTSPPRYHHYNTPILPSPACQPLTSTLQAPHPSLRPSSAHCTLPTDLGP